MWCTLIIVSVCGNVVGVTIPNYYSCNYLQLSVACGSMHGRPVCGNSTVPFSYICLPNTYTNNYWPTFSEIIIMNSLCCGVLNSKVVFLSSLRVVGKVFVTIVTIITFLSHYYPTNLQISFTKTVSSSFFLLMFNKWSSRTRQINIRACNSQ